MNSNIKGNIGLGQAIAFFTKEGYIVSIPLNDSQKYDLIVEKDSILQTVQVKYTSQKNNSGKYICRLSTTSPAKGNKLYSIVDTFVDLLFIYCENNDSYLIPIKDIPNKEQITLFNNNKSSFSNLNIFDTSEYLINKNDTITKNISIPNKIDDISNNSISIRKVLQYDLQGNFINEYDNCSDAARKINIEKGASNIARACRGERKTAYNFQWKYKI